MNKQLEQHSRRISVEMAACDYIRAIDNDAFADFIGGVDKALDDLRKAVKECEGARNDR